MARWEREPPTEKQLGFLERLGYTGRRPKNKLEASEIIDALLQQERPAPSVSQGHGCLTWIAVIGGGVFVLMILQCGFGIFGDEKNQNVTARSRMPGRVLDPEPETESTPAKPEPNDEPEVTSIQVAEPTEESTPSVNEAQIEPEEEQPNEPAEAPQSLATPPSHEELIESAKWRLWTAGSYQARLKFVALIGKTVRLQKENGTTIELTIERLSEEDAAWIHRRGWLDEAGQD